MEINTIGEGPRHGLTVAPDDIRGASASSVFTVCQPAGAGIHGGHQLETGWIAILMLCSDHRDFSAFQWLPELIQNGSGELSDFIKK
jgi:hypothetical protein